MRRFDPNKNPYADDLIRLTITPSTRYRPSERRALATIIASKLYHVQEREHWPLRYSYRYIDPMSGSLDIDIVVIFDSDEIEKIAYLMRRYHIHDKLILLSIGENAVVEVFNGRASDVDPEKISAAVARLRENGTLDGNTGEGMVLVRSEDDLADDYRGKRRRDGSSGGEGGGGGDGGDDGDGPGPNDIPGSGGARELMNHPVLFAVESNVFDAIMEQV